MFIGHKRLVMFIFRQYLSHLNIKIFKDLFLGPARWHKWLRSSPCTPGIPYGRRFYPGCPTSLPAPCLWPGKAVEDSPKLWDPAPTWETRKSSWLRIGIALAVALTWGVIHRTEDLPLCLSSLYIHLSNEKIIKINL